MKRITLYAVTVFLVSMVVLALLTACASAPSPTPTAKPTPPPAPSPTPGPTAAPKPAASPAKAALPQVPITYAGDTDEAVIQRAKWVEGAKKEGAMAWWGSDAPGVGVAVVAAFNKVYPFIKVDYWSGKGEEIASKLELESGGGRLTVDLTRGVEATNYPRLRELGLLERFVDRIPAMQKVDKRSYSKYGDWVSPHNTALVPQYNTKPVSAADAPKNWDDLLNPKWAGKIGLTTDVKGWWTLALGGWGMEKTEQFLTKLKSQKPIWATSFTSAHSLVIAGEYPILAQGYLYHLQDSLRKGAPLDWVRVNPIPITLGYWSIPKGSPHPNAAMLFMEWLVSSQGLTAYEDIATRGAAWPGSGSKMSKLVEGLDFALQSEEMALKAIELGLDQKFTKILGIP